MTPEQITKAVAELDGFENVDIYIKRGPIPFCISVLQGTRDGLGESQDTLGREMFVIPQYLTYRDAIVPVIEKQDYTTRVEIVAWFKKQSQSNLSCALDILKATPPQLCEALLRATGKWVES
jgi:hypothetical protein